jgi:ribose transport system ATP-binding protein
MTNVEATTAGAIPTAAVSVDLAYLAVESTGSPALSVRGLSKAFGPAQALWPIDLEIRSGEIHALLGENGSGKSTLIKSLSGYHTADTGQVWIAGEKLTPGSSAASHALGCRFVHQDLGLIHSESVLDNLNVGGRYKTFLGTIDARAALRTARADLARVGIDIDPKRAVGTLSPAEQTAVAVARALRPEPGAEPRLLVLDEPTARLPHAEVEQLLDIVRASADAGVAVIYVTHRIEEVFKIAENVTVLRDGHKIATSKVADLDQRGLVDLLVGSAHHLDSDEHRPGPAADAAVGLRVRHLTTVDLTDVNVEVRQGEVVGIAGITGSGREVILSTIFGGTPRSTGSIEVGGTQVRPGRPDHSIAAGVAYLPPDRKVTGGLIDLSARENLILANLKKHWHWPRLSRRGEQRETTEWFRRLTVRPAGNVERPLSAFSGGNQQKILFAKWLRTMPKVLLLDEPTQGVDIVTKSHLHKEIIAVADAGACVVVSSSDTDELIAVCHRILVMRNGRIVGTLSGKDKTVVNLSHTSFGTAEAGASS